MSGFGLTDVAQLQPGSDAWAPSMTMSSASTRVPLPEKLPTALCLPPSPLPLIPMISPLNPGLPLVPPLAGVMPGSSFRSSAVERPTIGTF